MDGSEDGLRVGIERIDAKTSDGRTKECVLFGSSAAGDLSILGLLIAYKMRL